MRDPSSGTAALLARARSVFPALTDARHLATSVKCTLFTATLDEALAAIEQMAR